MTTKFPYGYARPSRGGPMGMGTMLTWEQMMTKKTVYNLHPEVQRRLKALIEYAATRKVPLGVGTGWRVQPNPPPKGFAKPGNSWHESCPVNPAAPSALAIDTVPNISWDWLGTNCGAFGFRTFTNVNNEPWHIQPSEIPAARRNATKLPPLYRWRLPGDVVPKPPQPPQPQGEEDMAQVPQEEWNQVRDRVLGSLPGDYSTQQRALDPPPDGRLFVMDNMDGNYMVQMIQQIMAEVQALRAEIK